MTEPKIRIVEHPSMKVISFHGFGQGPEDIAIAAMLEWVEKHTFFEYKDVRCFGFNNPDPTPGSPNYGYEIWLTLPDQLEISDAPVKTFSGGTYAVVHCEGSMAEAEEFIPSAWKSLMEWLENNKYQLGQHQWLEEHLGANGLLIPQMIKSGRLSLDLHLPIR